MISSVNAYFLSSVDYQIGHESGIEVIKKVKAR
jgi:hypothetical protein